MTGGRSRCEVCERPVPIIACASLDQPTLYFCPEHYVEHVVGAHAGTPLPGCASLDEARTLAETVPKW